MRPRWGRKFGLMAAVCLALVATSCGVHEAGPPRIMKLPPCATGTPSPVSLPTLIRRFAAHGIAMHPFRTELCDEPHTVAQLSTDAPHVSAARRRSAVMLHGVVRCALYDSSRTETLERLTFAHGRTAAVFSFKNVSCTVYPNSQIYPGSPDRHREQDRAVELVIRSLSG